MIDYLLDIELRKSQAEVLANVTQEYHCTPPHTLVKLWSAHTGDAEILTCFLVVEVILPSITVIGRRFMASLASVECSLDIRRGGALTRHRQLFPAKICGETHFNVRDNGVDRSSGSREVDLTSN
jgi:hypothetical protein